MFVFLTVCICKYVRMCFHVCICAVLFMCVCIRVCLYVCIYMCYVYIHVCVCVCMYAYMYICVYTCEHARKHLSLPGYVGVHAPILVYVFSFYPISCVTKRWPVTQLRLRLRLVRAISLPCAFPLRLVGTNFGPSLFVFSYCSLH